MFEFSHVLLLLARFRKKTLSGQTNNEPAVCRMNSSKGLKFTFFIVSLSKTVLIIQPTLYYVKFIYYFFI